MSGGIDRAGGAERPAAPGEAGEVAAVGGPPPAPAAADAGAGAAGAMTPSGATRALSTGFNAGLLQASFAPKAAAVETAAAPKLAARPTTASAAEGAYQRGVYFSCPYKDKSSFTFAGSNEINYPYLLSYMRQHDAKFFYAAFDASVADVKRQVESGAITVEQGQAALYEVYEKFAYDGWNQDAWRDRFDGGSADVWKTLQAKYEAATVSVGGKEVSLSGPYRTLDSDVDGVRDIEEVARGTSIYEHNGLARTDPALAKQRAEILRARLEPRSERPAPGKTGAPARTYAGDEGNALVPADGYLRSTPKGVQVRGPDGLRDDLVVPEGLALKSGTVKTKKVEIEVINGRTGHSMKQDALLISDGKRTLLAVPDRDGKLTYYAKPTSRFRFGDDIPVVVKGPEGKQWTPLDEIDDPKLSEMARAYGEAFRVSNGGAGRLSPADAEAAAVEIGAITKSAAETGLARTQADARKRVEDSIALLGADEREVRRTAERLGVEVAPFQGLVAAGIIVMKHTDDGAVELDFADEKPKGMTDGEWAKIKREWYSKVEDLDDKLDAPQAEADRAGAARETDAARLYNYITTDKGEFLAYVRSLPPEKRWTELARVAEALKGTDAGAALARDLVAAKDGKYAESSELAWLLVKEMPAKGEGRDAVAEVMGALLPGLGRDDTSAMSTALEMILGRDLSREEFRALLDLSNAETPTEFQRLANESGAVGDLLGAIGDSLGDKHMGAQKHLGKGAVVFASFKLIYSVAAAAKDPTGRNVAEAGGDLFSAVGTWSEVIGLMKGSKGLQKFGKATGAIGGAIEVGLDVYDAIHTKGDDEDKARAWGRAAASGAMLAGTLIASSNPVGWVVIGAGLLTRYWLGKKSEAYQQVWGALEKAFEQRTKELRRRGIEP